MSCVHVHLVRSVWFLASLNENVFDLFGLRIGYTFDVVHIRQDWNGVTGLWTDTRSLQRHIKRSCSMTIKSSTGNCPHFQEHILFGPFAAGRLWP